MRNLISWTISLVVMLGAALPACGQLPGSLGRLKDKLSPYQEKAKQLSDINKQWTADEEEKIGEAGAARLIHAFHVYENPAMQQYINLVGNAVAAQGARTGITYHFAILDIDSLDALALPGGFVFVS